MVKAIGLGVPAIVVATERFVTFARTLAAVQGIDELPLLVLPYPFESLPEEQIRAIAREQASELVALLATQMAGAGSPA
jgi:hypothetical protein